jgi:hypothetical protein
VRFKKDLDLIVRPIDCERALELLALHGFQTEMTFSHWLGKVFQDRHFIDIIFNSGNGVAAVDDEWMAHGIPADVLGMPAKLCPPEEMIWSKAFVMERERYDGADIAHLLYHTAKHLDWPRLLRRFGPHWPVLFSHVVLFDYVYPDHWSHIPTWVRDELRGRYGDLAEFVEPGLPCRYRPIGISGCTPAAVWQHDARTDRKVDGGDRWRTVKRRLRRGISNQSPGPRSRLTASTSHACVATSWR